MSFSLVQCAGNMFQPTRKRVAAYAAAVTNADVATFTEAQKDHAAIKALGFGAATLVELAIVWNPDRFNKVDQGGVKVMDGGKRGDGLHKADKRRRGPNRYVLWVVLLEKSTGQEWLVGVHHAIAKPDTSFLWRRRLHAAGIKNAAAEIRKAQAKHPGAQTVLAGDWNRKRGVNFGLGLTEVKTPATFGKLRYDRVQTDPDVRATGIRTFATGLDHKAIAVRLSAMGTVTKPPAPAPTPKPKPEVPMTAQEKVTAAIKAEVGYHEGRSGGHWNNVEKYAAQVPGLKWVSDQGQPWCAVFAAWGLAKGGLVGGKDFPVTASCDVGGNWYKARKRWSEYPAVGAQVFYGSPKDLNHTGIVVAYDATTITTVEGNTNANGSREGDGVYLKTHQRRSVNVVGYGYPLYASIDSADPAWGRVAPRPTTGGVKPWPVDGIDLSHHNSGRIDWALAKAGGVRFVYHKATQHTAFRDDMYAARRAEVKAQRLPFGAYHYAQPDKSNGTVQARFFLATAKPAKGDLRPMLDLEETGGLSMTALTKWVRDFVAEVKRQTGKPPVLYTKFELTADPGCYLWTARYSNANAAPSVPKAWKHWTIHQFSNGEFGVPRRCPGIDFPVDINTLAPGFDIKRLEI